MSPRPQLSKPMRRSARTIDVIIIGGGHAGLAMSRQLSRLQVQHVVLEAGAIAQRWRSERWDSLNLLTPNWTLRLPDQDYDGADPDGFLHKDELANYLERYARAIKAPVKRDTRVHRVSSTGNGFLVTTAPGEWRCRALVVATGAFADAIVPGIAASLPSDVAQITARDYRNPGDVGPGKVLVVGASATGLQLAQELNQAGRDVVLAVGEHVRMPRDFAERDVYWWLERSGVLRERADEVEDLQRARRLPSPQLVGRRGAELNLGALHDQGVELVGRLVGVRRGQAQFSGNLANLCKSADLKMQRLLERFRQACPELCRHTEARVTPTQLPKPRLTMPLGGSGIATVLWATGFKPDHSWLDLDVFDRKGALRHAGGVAAAPGLYALGLPLMRSRASTFVAGAEEDTRALASHLRSFLDTVSTTACRRHERPRAAANQ